MKYLKFILKRDLVTSIVWIVALAAFALLLAAVYPGLFPTEMAMQGIIATTNTPAMIALMGPVYGLDAVTPAILMAQECLIWFAIAAIVMNIFFVNRYTRTDEELGRLELLISLPVNRLTNSISVIYLSFLLNVVVAVMIAAFTLIVPNLEGITISGAFMYGLSIGMQGFVFAMITLLSAQLFSTARGSMGAAFAMMGIAYILRAYGDMNGSILSDISPMGLGLKVEAFYADNFLPIAILFAEALGFAAIALWFNFHRDIGLGVFPARKGKGHASRFLQTPFGFAWRLSRNNFFAWAIGIFAIGATYGSVIGELDQFVEGNDMMKQMLEGSSGAATLIDAFVGLINGLVALIIAVPLIGAINRLRSEEKRGRLEPILATSVSRRKLFLNFILIAVAEAFALAFLSAFGLYAAASSSGLIDFDTLIKASFVYLPALFVMIALAVFLFGVFPKLKSLIWALFGYSFILFYFGRLFDVPEIAIKLSPFGNISQLPVQELSVIPMVVLCIISVGLCVMGVLFFEKRGVKN